MPTRASFHERRGSELRKRRYTELIGRLLAGDLRKAIADDEGIACSTLSVRPGGTLLKGMLRGAPSHPRALPTLLEAVALWQGAQVRAVLCAEARDTLPNMRAIATG